MLSHFLLKAILVEGDLLSGKSNYFNVFQSFFSDFLCFLLVYSHSTFFSFIKLNFGLHFVVLTSSTCNFVNLNLLYSLHAYVSYLQFLHQTIACVVFDPDYLKKSYGVNNTGEFVEKVVICDVRNMYKLS